MVRRRDRPVAGSILPGYRDVAEIGGGAFATVYRATEADTGRQVALKILEVDAVHRRLLETFAREIEALAKVSDHPNIVTLYRPLATPDGRPGLASELCRESLAQQVHRTGPIGARDVTRIGIKIAGALETAHRHGFLHRDVKPQNILVTQFGEPALGDFGVAALQASAPATAGVFGFSALHAAPEILEGRHLSPATDVYGLASSMYQLLAGMAPFATFDNEPPASVILRIIRDPVRPLRSEDVPLGLSDLIEAALSKDPDRRPHGAVDFAEALLAVETAAGWTPTAYVACGESALRAPPVVETMPAPGAATTRAPLHVHASSGTPPSPAPPGPAPPGPASPGPAPPGPASPGPAPPGPASSGPAPPGPAPPGPASSGPAPPPPPGPSVTPPPAAARHVVTPDQAARGPANSGLPPPASRPLAPLRPAAEGPTEAAAERPPRPVFLDAPVPISGGLSPVRADRPASVYDQTILPIVPTRLRQPTDDPLPSRARALLASPLLLAAIGVAAAVVVGAILLIIGIL